MISKADRKSIFVCWMNESGNKNGHVDDFIQYLENQNLLNTAALPEFLSQKKEIIENDRKACEEREAKKKAFTKEVCDVIMTALTTAPESQLAPHLRERSIAFCAKEHTLMEYWTYINNISKFESGADVSSFIRDLCWTEPFYRKPE